MQLDELDGNIRGLGSAKAHDADATTTRRRGDGNDSLGCDGVGCGRDEVGLGHAYGSIVGKGNGLAACDEGLLEEREFS